jgi:integrase
MKIGGYDMAKKTHHHLYQRKGIWYFRKGSTRITLETTVATEAKKIRDRMLENYKLTGQFYDSIEDSTPMTFGFVAKEWAVFSQNRVRHSTWRDYRSSMNLHVLPTFKDTPINSIEYIDIETFISNLQCGPKRINNILIPMRSVFKMAYKNGYVPENVMLKVDNMTVPLPDIFPFSFEEVVRILEVIDPFYRPYTATRFFTGMRSGEIDALLWSDHKTSMPNGPQLHVNKSYVYGIDGPPKTKTSKRYVDCLGFVVDALEDQRKLSKNNKYIFLTKDGNRMNPDHYRDVVWKRALEKAGMEYRPPIQTRHTFATMMLSSGEDIGWVQAMMGHSSLQMIYTRYYKWIPQKTRNDGSAFMASVGKKQEYEKEVPVEGTPAKVIPLFPKNDTITTHPNKKGLQ